MEPVLFFCLLGKEDDWLTRKEPDPLDMSEWIFWVVANQNIPNTESISLIPFKNLYGEGIRFEEVREEINKIISELQKEDNETTSRQNKAKN